MMKEVGKMNIDGEVCTVKLGKYDTDGGTPFVGVFTDSGEFYCNVTVNLEGYGIVPQDGYIFIHHDLMGTRFYEDFKKLFAVKGEDPAPLHYGYAKSETLKVTFVNQ